MNELKRHYLALSFIAMLLCLKFVFVPIIDWQEEKLAKLALLDRKTHKIEQLLLNKASLDIQHQELQSYLVEFDKQFYPTYPVDTFKLQQQKLIESKVNQFDLIITNIGWKNQTDLLDAPLIEFPIEYAVDGTIEDVIRYILSTSEKEPFIELSGLVLTFRRPSMGTTGMVTARIKQVYFMKKFPIELVQSEDL